MAALTTSIDLARISSSEYLRYFATKFKPATFGRNLNKKTARVDIVTFVPSQP